MYTKLDITHLIENYGYLIVYFGGVFEGEPVALLGGLAAKSQHLKLPMVMLFSQLGVFTSDQICFYFGRYFGKKIINRWSRLAKAIVPFSSKIENHRIKLTLTFQWIPGAGAVVPIALGMSDMPALEYFGLDLVSSALWSIIIPALGYTFGAAAESILDRFQGIISLGIGGGIIVIFIIGRYKLNRSMRRLSGEDCNSLKDNLK